MALLCLFKIKRAIVYNFIRGLDILINNLFIVEDDDSVLLLTPDINKKN